MRSDKKISKFSLPKLFSFKWTLSSGSTIMEFKRLLHTQKNINSHLLRSHSDDFSSQFWGYDTETFSTDKKAVKSVAYSDTVFGKIRCCSFLKISVVFGWQLKSYLWRYRNTRSEDNPKYLQAWIQFGVIWLNWPFRVCTPKISDPLSAERICWICWGLTLNSWIIRLHISFFSWF